jgi:hypothetical protein
MRQHRSINQEELSPIYSQDLEAPEILQRGTKCMQRSITSNEYGNHSYQAMIFKCTHLPGIKQDTL